MQFEKVDDKSSTKMRRSKNADSAKSSGTSPIPDLVPEKSQPVDSTASPKKGFFSFLRKKTLTVKK